MDKDHGAGARPTGAMRLIAVALVAAALGFAAVYVTLGPADNASSPEIEAFKGGQDADSKGNGADGLIGFVKRSPPIALAEVAFKDEAGRDLKLSDFKGRTVLLNLWATWCTPCRHEMPSLDRLQADLGSDRFEVVALSLDRAGAQAARKFYDEIGVKNLKLYIDSTMRAGNTLKAVGMPTTILVTADGKEAGRLPGPAEWDSAEAKKIIAEAMQ
ncbi:MAG: TlpA disulfide reductase family protein [Hyphomicrobium sp.]|nr:TlpA disulfide reductase family protein [Hyphomicrobium sp.]